MSPPVPTTTIDPDGVMVSRELPLTYKLILPTVGLDGAEDLLPAEEEVVVEAHADLQIDDVVDRLKTAGLFDKTVPEIYTDVQATVDAITSLAEAKAFLRQAIPFLVAGLVWLIRRMLKKK